MNEHNVPTVYLAEAPDPLEPHGLDALHREDLSVVHFAAPVYDTKVAHASMSLLWALGKRQGVTGTHEQPSANVPLVPIWLTGHRTNTVIISAAQHWKAHLTQEVLRLVLSAGTSVVLVSDHGRRAHIEDAAIGFLPRFITLDDLHDLCPPDLASKDVPTHDWLDTPLPEADWPVFRSECRRTLPTAAFREVDSHYLSALRTSRDRLAHAVDRDDETTRELLIELLSATDHSTQAIAVLRATQAAHFEAGWNLRVDAHEAISLINQSRSIAYTPRDWRAIRAYRQPGRAAACVLYGAELTVQDIEATTVGDIDDATTTGSINGFPLPDDALAVLRAARLERSLDAATSKDKFIVSRGVSAMLTNAAKDLGILVASTANRRSQHTANFWQYRLGFVLQRIR